MFIYIIRLGPIARFSEIFYMLINRQIFMNCLSDRNLPELNTKKPPHVLKFHIKLKNKMAIDIADAREVGSSMKATSPSPQMKVRTENFIP